MTTERLEEIRLGSCPTCGGPAQFIDPSVPASEREGLTLHHAVRSGVEAETSFYVREVRLPNIDEDLGNGWTLAAITHRASSLPSSPLGLWYATASRRRPSGGLDFEYGFGDDPTRAYLGLRTAVEARR